MDSPPPVGSVVQVWQGKQSRYVTGQVVSEGTVTKIPRSRREFKLVPQNWTLDLLVRATWSPPVLTLPPPGRDTKHLALSEPRWHWRYVLPPSAFAGTGPILWSPGSVMLELGCLGLDPGIATVAEALRQRALFALVFPDAACRDRMRPSPCLAVALVRARFGDELSTEEAALLSAVEPLHAPEAIVSRLANPESAVPPKNFTIRFEPTSSVVVDPDFQCGPSLLQLAAGHHHVAVDDSDHASSVPVAVGRSDMFKDLTAWPDSFAEQAAKWPDTQLGAEFVFDPRRFAALPPDAAGATSLLGELVAGGAALIESVVAMKGARDSPPTEAVYDKIVTTPRKITVALPAVWRDLVAFKMHAGGGRHVRDAILTSPRPHHWLNILDSGDQALAIPDVAAILAAEQALNAGGVSLMAAVSQGIRDTPAVPMLQAAGRDLHSTAAWLAESTFKLVRFITETESPFCQSDLAAGFVSWCALTNVCGQPTALNCKDPTATAWVDTALTLAGCYKDGKIAFHDFMEVATDYGDEYDYRLYLRPSLSEAVPDDTPLVDYATHDGNIAMLLHTLAMVLESDREVVVSAADTEHLLVIVTVDGAVWTALVASADLTAIATAIAPSVSHRSSKRPKQQPIGVRVIDCTLSSISGSWPGASAPADFADWASNLLSCLAGV